MTNPITEMKRHETAEVSEDGDRTTEAPPEDFTERLNESAYAKHLWLIKQNTDLRVQIISLKQAIAELQRALEDVCCGTH